MTEEKEILLTDAQKAELEIIGNMYRQAIYSEPKLLPMVIRFYKSLESHPGEISQEIVAEVIRFSDVIQNKHFISTLRSWINELFEILSEALPPEISITINCRQKSFQSMVCKVIKNYLEGKSVDLFDLLAFRIVLDSLYSKEELEPYCYTVKDICISFFRDKRSTLCTPNKLVGSDGLMKDYIKNPKANGYQSIHLAFKTREKDVFEVQIRTLDMHDKGENGEADHGQYKDDEYALLEPYIYFNIDEVRAPLFRRLSNGTLYDQIGLLTARRIEKCLTP